MNVWILVAMMLVAILAVTWAVQADETGQRGAEPQSNVEGPTIDDGE